MAVADVSNDGNLDLVIVNNAQNSTSTVSVLIGSGHGTFRPKVDYPIGAVPTAIAVADISGDGNPDLIVGSFANAISVLIGNGNWHIHNPKVGLSRSHAISVLIGNGTGTFNPKVDYPGAVADSIQAADLDGDGRPDVIAVSASQDQVNIFMGTGNGALAAPVKYATGDEPVAVVVFDVNHDGHLDIATSNYLAIILAY